MAKIPQDSASDASFQSLRLWLGSTGLDSGSAKIRHLVGDVSRRRYLRLEMPDASDRKEPVVLAWYPNDMQHAYRCFLESTRLLEAVGVPVPKVLATDPEQRFMALEDVGDRTLYHSGVGSQETCELYESALEIAERLLLVDREQVAALNPPLDRALLEKELDQTWELFFEPALVGREALARRLQNCLHDTVRRLDEEPFVVCHRDLMARNIHLSGRGLIVLDHQDLRLGPAGYDLASLLHDSLRLSIQQRRELESAAITQAAASDRGGHVDIRLSYWLCVVQRTAKIIGTFCRFALTGGRRHLPLIPSAIDSLCEGLADAALWPSASEQLGPVLLDYWSANLDDAEQDPS